MSSRSLASAVLLVAALIVCASAASQPKNVTIDDFYGDPVTGEQVSYGPSLSFWNIGQNCTACTARPNASDTYNHTWHDGTFYPLVQETSNFGEILWANVSFNGTAVYVYTVLAHTSSGPDGASDMTFFIDNEKSGTFAQLPDNSTVYSYNQLVYQNTSLSAQPHSLSIQLGYLNYKSLLLLDYITYTSHIEIADPSPTSSSSPSSGSSTGSATSGSETSTSNPAGSTQSSANDSAATSSSHKSDTAAIAGGVVGGVAVIAIGAAIILFLRRRSSGATFNPNRMSIDGPSHPSAPFPPGSAGATAAAAGFGGAAYGSVAGNGNGSGGSRPMPPMASRPSEAPLMQSHGSYYQDQSATSTPGAGPSRYAMPSALAGGAAGAVAGAYGGHEYPPPQPARQYSNPFEPSPSVDPPSSSGNSHSRSGSDPSTNPNELALRERVNALEALVLRMHENGTPIASGSSAGGDRRESVAPPDYFSESDSGGFETRAQTVVDSEEADGMVGRSTSRRIVVTEKGRPMMVR